MHDNYLGCHKAIELQQDSNNLRWYCTECYEQGMIKKDWRGIPDNREYAKVFKREILQGNSNLFYKYYPQHLMV